jgi:ketol-acid reductoisomerase
MATIYYDNDADLSIIQSKKVAIIGYGSQGHAHALNLKDSGVDVAVGLSADSKSRAKAAATGLAVKTVAEAAAVGRRHHDPRAGHDGAEGVPRVDRPAPDRRQDADVRARLQHPLRHGDAAEGRRRLDDCAEVAGPPRPRAVRRGGGTPALVAIEQDATGKALALALSYGKAIGTTRAGVLGDDVQGRDRDGPLRRAGGTVRRRERAREGRASRR